MSDTPASSPPCEYCGNRHHTKCPLVKAIEYFENGQTKRVEFFAPQELLAEDKESAHTSLFEEIFGPRGWPR